jgi:hypothetical protein
VKGKVDVSGNTNAVQPPGPAPKKGENNANGNNGDNDHHNN